MFTNKGNTRADSNLPALPEPTQQRRTSPTRTGIASIIAYKTVGSPWHVSLGALAGVALAVILPPSRSGIGTDPEHMP